MLYELKAFSFRFLSRKKKFKNLKAFYLCLREGEVWKLLRRSIQNYSSWVELAASIRS